MSSAAVNLSANPKAAPAHQPLATLAVAFMAGVVADRAWPWRMEWWWIAAIAALGMWLCLWRFGFLKCAACWLLLAVACLGGARHHQQWNVFSRDDLGRFAGAAPQPICLEAIALERPHWRPAPPRSPLETFERGDQMRLDVRIHRVRDGDVWRAAAGKSSVTVEGHLPRIEPGDRLRIFGEYQRPQPPFNPGEYDFAAAERTDRKLCRITVDHPDAVAIAGRGRSLSFRRWLHAARDGGDRLLWEHVGPQRAALASALLLGSRQQLAPERRAPFFVTGMMHVLAISGLNLAILAAGFWVVARLLTAPRRATLGVAIVLAVFYAMLTNAEPPVVRAAVLIVLVCVGRLLGQPVLSFNTLAAAALVVLAINPAELFSAGAQLSFLGFGALVLASRAVSGWSNPPADPLDRLIVQTRPWPQRLVRGLSIRGAQLIACSFAIWLAVLPLTLYRFHIASAEGILLNVVVGIPLGIALYAGFGVLLFGSLAPPLASLCGRVCDGSLAVLEGMIGAAERGLGAHAWSPGPPGWWVAGYYAGLFAWASFPQFRPPRRWLAATAAGWASLALLPPDNGFEPIAAESTRLLPTSAGLLDVGDTAPPESPWSCTFVSVGHGVSALVEFPDGRTLLYDAGSLGSPVFAARGIAGVLWSRGLRRVDAVVLSHADADHYNALPELLTMFSVGVVYVSPLMFDNETPPLTALREAIRNAGIPIREISMGDRLDAGVGVLAEILHPPPRGTLGTDNANSIVLHVEAHGRRILLTGDLEGPGMDDLLDEEPVAYDAALAPHHGSAYSNPPGFAAWATPQAVVISGGQGDISADVKHAYASAGCRVFHTAEDGAVRVTLTRAKLHVQTWRDQPDAASGVSPLLLPSR
jgi:competence protein ComEC